MKYTNLIVASGTFAAGALWGIGAATNTFLLVALGLAIGALMAVNALGGDQLEQERREREQ